MSLLKCLRIINSNQLINRIEINNRILNVSLFNRTHLLQPTNLNDFNQKRFARFPTVKRRKTHKLHWWPKKTTKQNHNRTLSVSNQDFIQKVYKDQYSSPLNDVEIEPKKWTPSSKRVGLIARKLGVLPVWLKTGERVTSTLLQIVDNHVINCQDIEQTKKNTIYQNRWYTHNYATAVIGAETGDVTRYTKEYCGIFTKAGLPPKQKITKMVITEDAMLPPGTPLYALHFKVGQRVDVYGKTIDHGFQGVVKRWGFKGDGRKHHGATKAHRRPGSIGQSRKSGGPMKGRRMPGHMGSERRTLRSMEVIRINRKHNIIWVRGQNVPGLVNSYCYIFDALCEGRGFDEKDPPPFPTYIPSEKDNELPEDIYHPGIFVMDSETIEYPKVEETKRRTGAKIARIRK